jgi:hypothetical protein
MILKNINMLMQVYLITLCKLVYLLICKEKTLQTHFELIFIKINQLWWALHFFLPSTDN